MTLDVVVERAGRSAWQPLASRHGGRWRVYDGHLLARLTKSRGASRPVQTGSRPTSHRGGHCDVLPHGVPLVSVDSPFSLFKIDRVRRQVPVDAHMAVAMEVETFLTD